MTSPTRPDYPADTRGIVNPVAMARHVNYARIAPTEELCGLVDWFWSVEWSFPPGTSFDQVVLNHPCGHISVGTIDDSGIPLIPAQGRVYGVLKRASTRHLAGEGWTVAAKTTVGGLSVLLNRPVKSLVNQQLAWAEAFPELGKHAPLAMESLPTNEARIAFLCEAMSRLVAHRDGGRIDAARLVATVAARAETDKTIERTDQLAAVANTSVRTLQRLFDEHVGVSPAYVIRRFRILDAAEAAKTAAMQDADWNGWGVIAAKLGYADQAHLTRDFRAHLGMTPTQYARAIRQAAAKGAIV
jgi:AraC-like DNA-binding protein